MKQLKSLLFLTAFSCNLATAQKTNNLVILQSFKKPTVAQAAIIEQQMNTLGGQGFLPYLIQTDDYPPLRKGLWAVVLGPFDKETAKAKQQRVQTWVKDAYIKAVQAPSPQSVAYGYTTVETSLDKSCITCITAVNDGEGTGLFKRLCPGFNGYRVDTVEGDDRQGITMYPSQTEYDDFWLPEFAGAFPYLINRYPLTWIYRGNQLIALSAVFETQDIESTENHANRYVVNVGKKQLLCPIKKPFKVDDINAVLAYLNDNPNNCP